MGPESWSGKKGVHDEPTARTRHDQCDTLGPQLGGVTASSESGVAPSNTCNGGSRPCRASRGNDHSMVVGRLAHSRHGFVAGVDARTGRVRKAKKRKR